MFRHYINSICFHNKCFVLSKISFLKLLYSERYSFAKMSLTSNHSYYKKQQFIDIDN